MDTSTLPLLLLNYGGQKFKGIFNFLCCFHPWEPVLQVFSVFIDCVEYGAGISFGVGTEDDGVLIGKCSSFTLMAYISKIRLAKMNVCQVRGVHN